MLVASVLTDRRAIPVHVGAYDKRKIRRSQNSQENTFLRLLKMTLQKAGLKAIILCVQRPGRRSSRSLARQGLRPGGVLDLGTVALRKDGVVQVCVVGVWMPGAKEPWWLATDLSCAVQKLVAYYDRRMAIEEQLRDTKGCRFGLKLEWTQFQNPAHLARFTLVVGIAILVWTAAGIEAAKDKPSFRFPHPTKGPRQSFVTIGMRAVRRSTHGVYLAAAKLVRLLHRPNYRYFAWITHPHSPHFHAVA